MQELTDAFTGSRAELLELGREWKRSQDKLQQNDNEEVPNLIKARKGSKRKRADVVEYTQDADTDERPARRTRSQRKAARAHVNGTIVPVDDSEDDATYAPRSPTPGSEFEPDDGLVSCPVCNIRMKEDVVSAHLDASCPGFSNGDSGPKRQAQTPAMTDPDHKSKPLEVFPKRLPQLNYSLLNEAKLRKKLSELKIPSWGPRALLQRRHSEWVALWNANCDSKKPRSERALLRELDAWERSQGGNAKRNKDDFMDKDFDGGGWAQKNKADFDDLVQQARESRKQKKSDTREVRPSLESTSPNKHTESQVIFLDEPSDHRAHFNRALTAPPSTDAVPSNPLLATASPFEESTPLSHINPTQGIRQPPSLPNHNSEPDRPLSNGTPIHPTQLAHSADPPPPATLMWSKSCEDSDTAEAPITGSQPTPPIVHGKTIRTPSIARPTSSVNGTTRSPSATAGGMTAPLNIPRTAAHEATIAAEQSPIAGMAAAGAGLTRSASMSTPTEGRGGLSRASTGGADPIARIDSVGSMSSKVKKVPMFEVPNKQFVDGDGTGMR